MSTFDDLDMDARNAYRNGHYREAALGFEQARIVAKNWDMKKEDFASGFWAAHSWQWAGEILRALGGYMELLKTIPIEAETLDVWRIRKCSYEIRRLFFPELSVLERQVAELEKIMQEYPSLPPADASLLRADLSKAQGQWATQLAYLERGWQEYNGEGYYKYIYAYNALYANLALHRLFAAQRWCSLLEQTNADSPVSRAAHIAAQIDVAFYQQYYEIAHDLLIPLERVTEDLQHAGAARTLIKLQIRCFLLQSTLGDPQKPLHPARRRFAEWIMGKPTVFDIYNRFLLRVDYRLACVRWGLSIEAVDDKYYTQAQNLDTAQLRCSFDEIQQRIQQAQRALACAMRYATELDRRFECSWRQQEIQERTLRLNNLIACL